MKKRNLNGLPASENQRETPVSKIQSDYLTLTNPLNYHLITFCSIHSSPLLSKRTLKDKTRWTHTRTRIPEEEGTWVSKISPMIRPAKVFDLDIHQKVIYWITTRAAPKTASRQTKRQNSPWTISPFPTTSHRLRPRSLVSIACLAQPNLAPLTPLI